MNRRTESGYHTCRRQQPTPNRGEFEVPTNEQVQSSDYKKAFNKTVDIRIEYWKKRQTKSTDYPTYTAPNSHEEPKALEKVFSDVDKSKQK